MVRPAGPDTMTATLFPFSGCMDRRILSKQELEIYCSISLIFTGSPLIPSTQWPSHCFAVSQTREQTMERGLFSNSISAAVMTSISFKSRIISGILVLIGHPCLHRGFLHCRQREAWLRILFIANRPPDHELPCHSNRCGVSQNSLLSVAAQPF